MGFKIKQEDKTLFINVDNEFDTILAKNLQKNLEEKYKKEGLEKIIFDLSKTTHIASSGLRVMIFARERLGKQIKVSVLNAKGIVLDVFKMSGIDNFIDVVE